MIIVDVREIHEYEACSIPGSINLPLSVIAERSASFFNAYPDQDILIMCARGVRSEKARAYWIQNDYAEAQQLTSYEGGILEWINRGNEVYTAVIV